ncbi:MAG: VOC family protein [Devosia sp.]
MDAAVAKEMDVRGINSVSHIAIKVSEIERSLAFYRDGLEFPEMFRLQKEGKLWIVYLSVTETQFVELFPDAVGINPPWGTNALDHFCLEVDDLHAVVARIHAKGIELYRWEETGPGKDPRMVSDGLNSITKGADGNLQAWLRDPDGNRLELMQMLEGNMQQEAIARLRATRSER